VALRVRLQAERGRRLDRAFSEAVAGLDVRERAFAQELAYGVTRLRGRLDHLISLRVRQELHELDPAVLEILRLGAYQLLYMGGVPSYAAVSQAVEAARAELGDRPTGLVNAVLRGVGRAGEAMEAFPDPERDLVGFLETWGSHPRWLLERWLARWEPSAVRALVEADNRRPPTYLLPLGSDAVGGAATLAAAGLDSEVVGDVPGCLRLGRAVNPNQALAALPRAIVQDPAAVLVTRYADVPRGTKVADLCAAPGGKALALAEGAVYTLAADRSEPRLLMVKENARRVGRPLGLVVADARRPPLRGIDVILLDAPCSGTGTLARRPDARWRLEPGSLAGLAEVQREMLDAAAEAVRPGGLLVYSTCSLEAEENELQVDAFLARHADFRSEPSETVSPRFRDPRGRLFVTPQATGFDGAFAARLRKAA
jgi:16S rRNA (cytosine967-C5)-methyltransferase